MKRSIRHPFGILALAFFLLGSCGERGGEENGQTFEEKLAHKKSTLRDLQKEISALEDSLRGSRDKRGEEGRKVLVRTRTLRPSLFEHFVSVNASVEADKEVLLSSERQGKLEKLLVEEGQRVRKGEKVALQSQTLLKSRLKELRTRYQHARTVFEKQERLWKDKGVGSEMEYLNARNEMETLKAQVASLEEELDMTEIRSPIDGTVEEIRLKEGAFADPSRPILHIVGLKDLFVKADISERYLNRVHEEDSVEIEFPELDERFVRPVHSLGSRIHPQDRTFKVRVRLKNTEGQAIKPNLSAKMRIRDMKRDSAVVLPSALVGSDPEGDFVYLVAEDGTAKKRYIELGPSQGGHSLVKKGLEFGEKLVTAGYDQLSDGMAVKEEEKDQNKNPKAGSGSDGGQER